MAVWSGGSIQYWLLLLLLPTLLLAQDDCSHNCKREANRYYYVRPEGSAETLCPAQPCLTPSQLREHFSECERNNSCQTANTSLVLLPGTYTSASNHGPFIPKLKFLSLTGYNQDCSTDSLTTPSIDCNGTWISLMFQQIKCLQVRNCVVFTGNGANVAVDRVTFHDSLVRLASITADDHSELDYNYTLGSQTYCLLQKQLADINAFMPSHSVLAIRNVSFSGDYHTACAREHGIQLATIHATDSALDIADCLFTQNAVTHISFLRCTVHTSGTVQFENANTAIMAYSSGPIVLAGTVNFFNNNNSAIQAVGTHSIILLAGTVEFTNNTADYGGAVFLDGGAMTVSDNARVVFKCNHANHFGGAIFSRENVTIAGSVQFINNSADEGGAIEADDSVTIAENAQVVFQDNRVKVLGGAISSGKLVTIAGTVQFINNYSAYQGGAIFSHNNMTIANNGEAIFQGNHANHFGGAIDSVHHVTIAGTAQFINNSAYQGGAIRSDVNVNITNNAQVVFQNNHAEAFGGAIDSDHFVTTAGSVQFINNSAQLGGALSLWQVSFQGNQYNTISGVFVHNEHDTIAGSVQFINNSADQGGAVHSFDLVAIADSALVLFQGNHANKISGGAIHSLYITIAGSAQFINNSASQGGAISSDGDITLGNNAQVGFQGNRADSLGGAVFLIDANVVLAGSVQFISNTAQLGGAISMYPGHITVANDSNVVFQGNHAYHVGGAIYSRPTAFFSYLMQSEHCFISFGINCTMNLLHNTAERGGSAMYGMMMSKVVCQSVSDFNYKYLFDIITIIPDKFSAVSSDPLRVCVCPDQSTPDCLAILPDQNIPHLHYTVYPGQNFTIPVAVVGLNFALTSGSIYIQLLSSDASLGSESQYVQGVNQTAWCSQLQYSVLSDKTQEMLVLTTDGRQVTAIDNSVKEDIKIQNTNANTNIFNSLLSNPIIYYINNTFKTNLTDGVFHLAGYVQVSLLHTPVYVSVQLLDCPPGFILSGQQRCDCNDRILTNLLTCNINNQTVRRHGTIWVKAIFRGNTSNGVIVHKHCPFEYCKPEQLDVNLTHPETQCAFDRVGTLCGACKPNFSLALGGSQCLPNCSNKYLLLLIVFILAGFALVFFIKILNLTVSQGTMNGMIFYANMIAANRSIFFPAQHNKFLSFLSVFLSWLNLDLGIETCFIKGLDGYWKTWLQFVFPFYVWLIAAAIILVSHYSTRATKVFGDKSVSVLATLFLLSYSKLLRNVIIIFSFTTLEYPNNTTAKVWSFDGNLQYLSSKHIPLFLFALITLLLLWLPYTAVLLSAQWLRTQTHRKGLRWLKPFLDAYYGPFKDKHHYWVGVLLVVRGVLSVFFACFFAVENNVNLLLIAITSVAIPIYTSFTGRLYKRLYTTLLEHLCFLNLGILGIGTLYVRLVGGNQEALVTTSVGIAFLEFCGITSFHCYQFVIVPIGKWYAKVRANDGSIDSTVQLQPLLNSDYSSDDDALEYMPRNEVTHSEIRLSQLREEQDPPNPTYSEEHQLPPADMANTTHSEEVQICFNRPIVNSHQSDQAGANDQVALKHPTKQTDAAANEAASAPSQSKATTVYKPPPPQETSEPPRYFAAKREERFIDFNAPRETLLEYTQYRLPQERNEPARDSIAERELLSAPHEHPQESRYFVAEKQGRIDFSKPRESLLDYTQ